MKSNLKVAFVGTAMRVLWRTGHQYGRTALLWISILPMFGLMADVVTGATSQDAPGPLTNSQPSTLLTNVVQVLALSDDQARSGPKVQILGMVTFYSPGMGFFVQDESGGVFVFTAGGQGGANAGQFVEVLGVANKGKYSPIIDAPKIRVVDSGPTVHPRRVTLAEIYLGGLDAQWVELRAPVRVQRVRGGSLELELAEPPYRLSVWILDAGQGQAPQLTGRLISLKGVVGTATDAGPLAGFKLFTPNLANVIIDEGSQGKETAGPPVAVGDLKHPSLRADGVGMVRVKGVVTWSRAGRGLFVQDSTGGLEVKSLSTPGDADPGDLVEVTGFLGPVLEPPALEDASVKKLAADHMPKAIAVTVEELLQERHNQELVELEATLLDQVHSVSNSPTLVLQEQGHLVKALLQRPSDLAGLKELDPGARVRLVGVARIRQEPDGTEPVVNVLIRSPDDIKIISRASTLQRQRSLAIAAAAIIASLSLGAAVWYSQKKRRQTEHVLQLQAGLQAEMLQGEQQLRRSMEERDRIGRDLHDDIIQSIYAVGLNLEDCRRVIRESPQRAEARVSSAIDTLNTTIRSVRSFLSGLEPKVLNGREFKTALKSLALTSDEGPTPFHIDVDPSAANRLTSAEATQLLHIAKESMSNSLRHSQASSVTVSLHPVSGGVRLEVRDNGEGFNVETIPGTGHGLRNITARAREIGAELQILSAPGQGCRILVTVPQGNLSERV